jgi:hypothetical protein
MQERAEERSDKASLETGKKKFRENLDLNVIFVF